MSRAYRDSPMYWYRGSSGTGDFRDDTEESESCVEKGLRINWEKSTPMGAVYSPMGEKEEEACKFACETLILHQKFFFLDNFYLNVVL